MSRLIDDLSNALQVLQGVGPKSAHRMAMALVQHQRDAAKRIVQCIEAALENIRQCELCRTLCETPLCDICSDPKRDQTLVCVVEEPSDQKALERATDFSGVYFVLHGKISPLDGVGPEDLGLQQLFSRIDDGQLSGLILATGGTVEGMMTAEYIVQTAAASKIQIQRLSQGLPVGGELDYVDPATLSMAFSTRR